MGDSITEFWQNYTTNFFDYTYINRGISGQTTSQMLLRFRQDVINLRPSKVVILAGINDIAQNTGPTTVTEIMENVISMVQLAEVNKINVILCSVLPANHFYWNQKITPAKQVLELNKSINDYATLHKIDYVDYYSVMVDEYDGLQKVLGDDGIHPNQDGYQVMEKIVKPFIEKRLVI